MSSAFVWIRRLSSNKQCTKPYKSVKGLGITPQSDTPSASQEESSYFEQAKSNRSQNSAPFNRVVWKQFITLNKERPLDALILATSHKHYMTFSWQRKVISYSTCVNTLRRSERAPRCVHVALTERKSRARCLLHPMDAGAGDTCGCQCFLYNLHCRQ